MSIDDEFIDRILEGEASDTEIADFQAWSLVPENLQRFAFRAELHSDLRRSLTRRRIQESALARTEDGQATEPAMSLARRSTRVLRSRTVSGLTIAGLVTAVCILAAFMWGSGDEDSGFASTRVASVVSRINGVLEKDGAAWNDAQIPVGDYELRQGLLKMQFGGGVTVYVEAPARFDAVSSQRVVLQSGRLSARVPPEGVGFTVETPEAEIVDFGTEFSIDVEGGASEVHVFDGLVRVHPNAPDRRNDARPVDLRASQAVRISDGAVEPEGILIATDRFIRNFDEPRLNYARVIKRLSPLAFYRMPIRDRGLVSEPPKHSGIVLTGQGKRPPHARGVFVGGSLRVGADSTGRGARIDSPPAMKTGKFSLVGFVYLDGPPDVSVVASNFDGSEGSFGLSLRGDGTLQATIRHRDGEESTIGSGAALPQRTWRHFVVTANGERLTFYEDGELIASEPCTALANAESATVWFGTDPAGTRVWNGRIDEVALFDRAISGDEIAMLYETARKEIDRSR